LFYPPRRDSKAVNSDGRDANLRISVVFATVLEIPVRPFYSLAARCGSVASCTQNPTAAQIFGFFPPLYCSDKACVDLNALLWLREAVFGGAPCQKNVRNFAPKWLGGNPLGRRRRPRVPTPKQQPRALYMHELRVSRPVNSSKLPVCIPNSEGTGICTISPKRDPPEDNDPNP